ncbi:hypothetical protein KDA23_05950 [Candidatus Saccharibacteria bacterium]|nr:hypothetical protein [Candidatus Saccharibacteria bacterium]
MAAKISSPTSTKHHRLRTVAAAILGTLAISLILASLLVVWMNRTLTDTNTFVSSVGPIVSKPEVQQLIATEISDQVVKQIPVKDAARELLSSGERKNKSTDQLRSALHELIKNEAVKVLSSPEFTNLWNEELRSTHAAVVRQLNSGSDSIVLDLHPSITSAVSQLEATRLEPTVKKLEIPDDAGKISLEGTGIAQIHSYYSYFKTGTWLLVLVSAIALVGSIMLSVNHRKTIRRMLIGVGVVFVVIGLLLSLPSLVPATDSTQAAAFAIARSVLRNLQLTALVIGVACIAGAIAYKLIEQRAESKNVAKGIK